jgi:hypothetical protein
MLIRAGALEESRLGEYFCLFLFSSLSSKKKQEKKNILIKQPSNSSIFYLIFVQFFSRLLH